MPIFSSTPARITEPAVGASTCASGSQVWNGNIGTLIANASGEGQEQPELRVRSESVQVATACATSKV